MYTVQIKSEDKIVWHHACFFHDYEEAKKYYNQIKWHYVHN